MNPVERERGREREREREGEEGESLERECVRVQACGGTEGTHRPRAGAYARLLAMRRCGLYAARLGRNGGRIDHLQCPTDSGRLLRAASLAMEAMESRAM